MEGDCRGERRDEVRAGMGRMVYSPYVGEQDAWVGVEGEQDTLERRGIDGYWRR